MCRLCAAALAVLAAGGAAAQDVQVEVRLSREIARVGEPVGLVIDVVSSDPRVGQLSAVQVPDGTGLRFGEARSTGFKQESRIDGRGRRVMVVTRPHTLSIEPPAPGEYTIPPLTLTVDGEELTAPDGPMNLKVVEDVKASAVLYLDRAPLPEVIYEGEPFDVEIEAGWLTSLPVDVNTIRLQLPWWGRLDGVIETDEDPPRNAVGFPIEYRGRKVAAESLGEVQRDGRALDLYRIRRRFVATRPGTLELSGTLLAVTERRGRSRRTPPSYYLPLEDASIEVRPIPEEGRPLGWTEAVGRIEASADIRVREVDAGDPIALEVVYRGSGNLEFFDAPRLERIADFDDFRVLGVREEKGPFERVITYDLVPRRVGEIEVPSVPLWVFDTGEEAYTRVSTRPIAIRVLGSPTGDDPFGEGEDDAGDDEVLALRDIDGATRDADARPGPGVLAPLGVLAIGAIVGRLLARRRRRLGSAGLLAARRRATALKELRRRAPGAADARELSRCFEEFMAARTGTTPEAWIGVAELADGPAGAARPGGPGPGAREAYARVRAGLDAAVFAGDAGTRAPDSAEVVRAAEELCKGGAL